jgi:hypothetical protein
MTVMESKNAKEERAEERGRRGEERQAPAVLSLVVGGSTMSLRRVDLAFINLLFRSTWSSHEPPLS